MVEKRIALSFLAHPDDAEFMCTGTLALLRRKGWDIHIATMTSGDCGSVEYDRAEISRIRRAEAASSAKLLDGTYHCLEFDDVFIMYDRTTLLAAIGLVRRVRPAIVFTPSPSDYMVDHETTAMLVQTACFAAGMPNIEIDGAEPFEPIPHLYYVDAVEGKDKFGKGIQPEIVVDISSVMEIKEQMLSCHESQRSWLMAHHGIDEYVLSMKRFAEKRGAEINSSCAEGFRQHLGHAFASENILKSVLGNLVHEKQGTKVYGTKN
jgi:LmbE family N-acetylglucosaminyl deacetylase